MSQSNPYSGRYFDGISTRAQQVQVVLETGKVVIAQLGVWDEPIVWPTSELLSLEKEKSKLILRKGKPHEQRILEVTGDEFIRDFKYYNPHIKKIDAPASPIKYIVVSLLFLFLTSLALIYFFLMPWIVSKFTAVFPKDTEVKMGKMMLKDFLANEKIDIKGTELLNSFYAKSGIASSYKIHLTLVESPVVNAFALPGGEIVVYTGILKKMGGYPELVALAGHETGHIERRHSLKMLVKQFSAGLILGSIFQGYSDFTALLIQKTAELHRLSYSREAEEEADRFGYDAMQATGTDPKGMVALFTHMEEKETSNTQPPEFLMTHPTIKHRISIISKQILSDKKSYTENPGLKSIWIKIKYLHADKDASNSF